MGLADAFTGFNESMCVAEFASATRRMRAARAQVEAAANARRRALLTLHAREWTYEEIGKIVGISKQAAYQIIRKGTRE